MERDLYALVFTEGKVKKKVCVCVRERETYVYNLTKSHAFWGWQKFTHETYRNNSLLWW